MRLAAILLLLTYFISCAPKNPQVNPKTTKKFVQPTNGYAQMVVVQQDFQKQLYISGQIGEGETLEAQMRDALEAIKELLASEGATYRDLVKINTYIVDYKPSDLAVFRGVRQEVFGADITPASTLVGVQALALPQWKIEIDAVAVLDGMR